MPQTERATFLKLDAGMTDTVTTLSNSYRILQPPSLVNKYAALPSLHVGWNLLVGIALCRTVHHRVLKVVAALSPLAMVAAVVSGLAIRQEDLVE